VCSVMYPHTSYSTKGASLIPRIGFATINAILLLYLFDFICFLACVLLYIFLLRNSYVILCELYFSFHFFVLFLFCNFFKTFSLLQILFRVLIFLVLKKPEWAKRPPELKTSYEKSSHLLLFIQPMII